MPQVFYESADGTRRALQADSGSSVMEVARAHGVSGIVAECGGAAMCATCHVYVDPEWMPKLPVMEPDEDELLDGIASPREANSRLSCRLRLDESLDGLRVLVPATQY